MMKLDDWIRQLLADPGMQGMGHHQRLEDANLGLGWVYYGLARAYRVRHALVIGSHRGFVPLLLGRAIADNAAAGRVRDGDEVPGAPGRVTFIDPSLVDDFWAEPDAVRAYFERFGVGNIRHHHATTQSFRGSAADRALAPIDLLFVDGYHSHEQARFDFETFADRLTEDGLVLFHDSVRRRISRLYGAERHYEHTVVDYMDALRAECAYELLDLPLDSGVTLLRRRVDQPPGREDRPAAGD